MIEERAERLFDCLLRSLSERGLPLDRPLTVSQLVDDLIPYGAVRHALGVDLLADYEHALIHLLAGPGDRVELEAEEARRALRRELESDYPDVSVYRRFPDAAVRVAAEAAPPELRGDSAGEHDPLAPVSAATHPEPRMVPEEGLECLHCGGPLPPGRRVRYCPHCGGDQTERRCPRCRADLEPEWQFCIHCGSDVGATS